MIDDQAFPLTCLGKPISEFAYPDAVPFGIPIDVFVIARIVDEDGDVGYRLLSNPEMDTVNICGAMDWAKARIEAAWVRQGQGDDNAKGEEA